MHPNPCFASVLTRGSWFWKLPKGYFLCFSCRKLHLLLAYRSISQHDINLPETSLSEGGSTWVVAYCVRWWERCFWSGHEGITFYSGLLANWLAANKTVDTSACLCTHTHTHQMYTCHMLLKCCMSINIHKQRTHSDVAWLWAAGLMRCLSLTVSLSQEGGSLVDSSGVLRLPLYTAWLELNQKEVTSDL